jgi:heptosyltransferase-2
VFNRRHRDTLERSSTVRVIMHSNAVELVQDAPQSAITEVRVACLDGTCFAVRARVYVIATGAIETARLLLVAPGAAFGSSKLWPPEHFARACDGLARRHGLLPVLAPAPGEEAIAQAVVGRMAERALVVSQPEASLAELKALVARASLLLTNDTGPRQIAIALGRPAVVLMGPTDPRHTAHHLERQRVLREEVACSPCHHRTCPIDHRCLTRLAPERVLAAAEELLA